MITNELRDSAIKNSKFLEAIDFRINDFKMSDLRELIDERKRAEISELRKTLRENRNSSRISEPHYVRDFYWCSENEFLEGNQGGRIDNCDPLYSDKITKDLIFHIAEREDEQTDRIYISGNLRIKGDYGNVIQRMDESEPTDYWWSVTIYLGDR